MKPLIVAVEGVIAQPPAPGEGFAAATDINDGLWFVRTIGASMPLVFVTGSYDTAGVRHWLRSRSLPSDVLRTPPSQLHIPLAMVNARARVIDEVVKEYRGDVVVLEASRTLCQSLNSGGISVLQPRWATRRSEVGDDDFMPLRPTPQLWS